jgi:hypothetical protein
VPDRSGTSSTFFAAITLIGAAPVFFRFTAGDPNINGAKNPDCSQNSASAFPDGSRQLIGSIHSMGMLGIRMGTRLDRGPGRAPRPDRPKPGGLVLRGFIPFAPICNFGRVGDFH